MRREDEDEEWEEKMKMKNEKNEDQQWSSRISKIRMSKLNKQIFMSKCDPVHCQCIFQCTFECTFECTFKCTFECQTVWALIQLSFAWKSIWLSDSWVWIVSEWVLVKTVFIFNISFLSITFWYFQLNKSNGFGLEFIIILFRFIKFHHFLFWIQFFPSLKTLKLQT